MTPWLHEHRHPCGQRHTIVRSRGQEEEVISWGREYEKVYFDTVRIKFFIVKLLSHITGLIF